ncbi:MAG: hypothetical protein JNJ55_11960 [Betaproteobacteria bacterium]|nr:hypothetical protein [Betaproteobacteria bacterium]
MRCVQAMLLVLAVSAVSAASARLARAEAPPSDLAKKPETKTVPAPPPPRNVDLWLLHNLVRVEDVRYTQTADAIAALKRNRIDAVRVMICPLTNRESVDKLVDALVAAKIGVTQSVKAGSKELRCADNARVETRSGT